MRRLNLPPQVVRLVLLTIAIVTSYMIARYFLTPASFGELGWFRAVAMDEAAGFEPVYAGREACAECHFDQSEALAAGSHKGLSCEACHGAGQGHSENPDMHRMLILTFSNCVLCHEANPSRPAWHKQIDVREHYAGDTCAECHIPHQPNEVPE